MDPKLYISQSLPFESGNSVTAIDSDTYRKNHNKISKKDLSSQIEDNLSTLFECLKLEYGRHILVSPKWKNFGSQTLQLSEKTRLNNAIWRCWHIQYQKNKKPLFCQFVSPLSQEREPPKKPLTVILQGRYWRRKLDAIAREYKKWRIYYKQKNEDQDVEDNYERLRCMSTSSGDDETSHGSPLTQVVNLMDLDLTTDLVHCHPDTLFTTKTKKTSRAMAPEPTVSEIVFQPSLDSLQPNLDEFTKHLESLVDGMMHSNEPIPSTHITSYPATQDHVTMMSSNYGQIYSMETTDSTLVREQPPDQSFMDTTESFPQFPMDYSNQMEMQNYQTSPIAQPLSQLEEEAEQEIIYSQALTSPIQIPQSTLSSSQSSTPTARIPYRHSSSNLQEYSTSPTRKARLPRNVSDNQLSMIDSSQLNLNLPLMASQERKIPAKDQFPNLVAYLQSTNSGHTDTTASQAKRPRIPRNMSDSGLYNIARMSGTATVGLSYQHHFSTSPPQQTPLEQIRAQAAQANLPLAAGPTTSNTFNTQLLHQNKPHSGRSRKGKLPRNMSDSSLMYMNQQHVSFAAASSQRRNSNSEAVRVASPPSSAQSAHPVFSSTFSESHQVNEAIKQGGASSVNTATGMQTEQFGQITLMDQLVQISSSSSSTLPQNTGQQKNVQAINVQIPHQVPPVMNQMLLQGDSNLESQKEVSRKSQENQVMKQVLHLFQKQVPQSKQDVSQDASLSWKGPSTSQQPSELMSLLQGSTPPHGSFSVGVTQQELSQQQTQQLLLPSQQQQQLQISLLPQQQQHMSLPSPQIQQQQQISLPSPQIQQQQQISLPSPQMQQQQQISLPSPQMQQQQQISLPSSQKQQQQQISLPPQQVIQQLKNKDEQTPVFPLEQQLHQQLIHQQQQLQQQVQQNQQSSQLISALQSTNEALQQHLSQPPQPFQQLLQQQIVPSQQQQQQQHQGIVFAGKQDGIAKASNINIQPKPPATQSLTPIPTQNTTPTTLLISQSSTNRTGLPSQQVNMATIPSNLMSLQQILPGNTVAQVNLPSVFKLGSAGPIVSIASSANQQQTKVINSTMDSFSQSLLATIPCTTMTATTGTDTTMIATASPASNVATHVAFSPTSMLVPSPPAPKFTRPVSAADREHYKEHRRQSHISAEQKRRFNIKVGFDQLVNLVPALASQKNSKVSKATILHKSVEYITKLQREREKVSEEQEMLRKESQQLFNSISVCQQQLPAFGVPVSRQRADQMMAFFNQYVKTHTQENYKFWILSVMFRQLFESYNQRVTGSTWEEFCTSILSWMDEQCTLPTLRPAVLSALRDISRTTSILTEPSNVPQEIQRHVASQEDSTKLTVETARTASNSSARNFFNQNTMS